MKLKNLLGFVDYQEIRMETVISLLLGSLN